MTTPSSVMLSANSWTRTTKLQLLAKPVTVPSALRKLGELKPDILLLDLRMPDKDGFAVLEEVNFDTLPTRVVVLTAAEDDRDVIRAMRLGARGVVLKESAIDLLIKGIHRVHAGEIWLDSHMTAELIHAFLHRPNPMRVAKSRSSPTARWKSFSSSPRAFRTKEIGEKLFISVQTVKNHLHSIFDKTGVSDRPRNWLSMQIHHRLTTKTE